MRTAQLKSPLAGLVLAGIGATALVTLPSLAADAPGKLYFHSAAGSYAQDAALDPSASIGGRAPDGATLDNKVPTGTESATALSADGFGLPGSPVAPSWELPDTGTISSLCLDIWAESTSGAQTGSIVAHLYVQTGDTVVSNVEGTFASFSELAVKNYEGGVVRMTGLVKTPTPYALAKNTTLNFTISPTAEETDFTMHYDSATHPSSIAINPGKCEAGALPTAAPSAPASEEPSEEPSEAPSEVPSEVPSVEPSVTATSCPSGEPTGTESAEPSEEPSEEPSGSGSPTASPSPSGNANPVLALVDELTASSAPPSSSAANPSGGGAAAAADTEAAPVPADCAQPTRDTEVSYTGARAARYGDLVTFAATVTDPAGVPATGGTVSFVVGNTTYRANVGSAGKASVSARVNAVPETYLLETRYSGATGFAPSAAQDGFVVSKAVAVCSLQRGVSSSSSSLIGVLSRPDGARVAGAPVTFLYNNRSVGTAVTDSRGIARREAPRGRAGDVFSVAFAGDRLHGACRKDLRA